MVNYIIKSRDTTNAASGTLNLLPRVLQFKTTTLSVGDSLGKIANKSSFSGKKIIAIILMIKYNVKVVYNMTDGF